MREVEISSKLFVVCGLGAIALVMVLRRGPEFYQGFIADFPAAAAPTHAVQAAPPPDPPPSPSRRQRRQLVPNLEETAPAATPQQIPFAARARAYCRERISAKVIQLNLVLTGDGLQALYQKTLASQPVTREGEEKKQILLDILDRSVADYEHNMSECEGAIRNGDLKMHEDDPK